MDKTYRNLFSQDLLMTPVNIPNKSRNALATKEPSALAVLHGLHTYYAITVKQTGSDNYCSEEQLKYRLDQMAISKRYPLIVHDVVYELDSKNRLHLHALVTGPEKLWLKPCKGWHLFQAVLSTTFDKNNWEKYMHKIVQNSYDQEEILTLNQSRNLCLFDPI